MNSKIEQLEIEKAIESGSEPDSAFSHGAFNNLYAINSDLVGYLLFDSGIVEEPIVKGSSNDTYLRQSFKKTYSSQGTVFIDCEASFDSMHFTVFGHNVYYDDSAMFSPVSNLVNQSFYEQNKSFAIYTSDEMIRYEIAAVMYLSDDELLDYNYTQTSFDSEAEFNAWIKIANDRSLISSDIEIRYPDRFMTMQTCKRWDEHTIILVLAKEISRDKF